ncbi:MAG: type II toxin-antitoxin system PemK/MazF family toxin [Deltaproteobacteria bacterium]|nr:type II toxin-antitoxin system PemK/MazF family toxin [Deltaproteobacteria bacterium]
MVNSFPKRGDIYWINLDPTIGTEIKKSRPCLVISNDIANVRYQQVTVLPLTSKNVKHVEPFQVFIGKKESGLGKDSKALAEQIRTVSKLRLVRPAGIISAETLSQIDNAIRIHLALG